MRNSPTETPIDSRAFHNRDQSLLLSEHVLSAIKDYFSRIDGHEVNALHQMVIAEVERPLIQAVLEQYGYNQCKTAQALGLSRSTLRKKINLYGLE
jgi:Fis family transcriptional regulator